MTPLFPVLAAAVLAAAPATTTTGPTPVHELRLNLAVDGLVTGSSIAAWVLTESVFKHALAPDTCRWCDPQLNSVDAFGRGVAWPVAQQLTADFLSNLGLFALMPAVMVGVDWHLASRQGAGGKVWEDVLIIAQAVALSAVMNQAVKFAVGRQRPFVRALPPDERPLTDKPDDNNLSFYSGHTSFAFALLFATAAVADLRGYEGTPVIWAIGLPLALSIPYFRMAADRHYLTDVLTGAVIGGLFGAVVPRLFHGRTSGAAGAGARLSPAVGAGTVGLSGTF